jgi:hypothetical protein
LDSNKVIWTLELIEKLKTAQIGDESRLNVMKKALENGKTVYSDDKKYLQEQFKIMQERGEQQIQTSAAKSDKKRLYIISKLQEAEIGNHVKLETIKETILGEESISVEDDAYLDEKYEQLKKVDDSEAKVQQKLEMIQRLKHSEIGSYEKLDECKSALNDSGKLTEENESYLQEKIEQYNKIHKPKPATPAPPPRAKKIVKKRTRPVDPDAKYCAFCQRNVHPERDFSVGALVVLLFLGIIPGLLYYALKAPNCPICKHHQWQIPPDEE